MVCRRKLHEWSIPVALNKAKIDYGAKRNDGRFLTSDVVPLVNMVFWKPLVEPIVQTVRLLLTVGSSQLCSS
jgi:hypothetical protein